jgi:hypothetical protein
VKNPLVQLKKGFSVSVHRIEEVRWTEHTTHPDKCVHFTVQLRGGLEFGMWWPLDVPDRTRQVLMAGDET